MRSTSQNSVKSVFTIATTSPSLLNTSCLLFKPVRSRNSRLKVATLALLLFTSGFTACKSSMEEELIPETVENETVMSAMDLGASAEKGAYHLKDHTFKDVFSFPIGAAVVKERLESLIYVNTLKKDFSRLSSEGDFKFYPLAPGQKGHDYEKADAIVAFAQKNNMQVHGHTLIWAKASRDPKWLLKHKGNKKDWEKILKDHITGVMKHFKGKVSSWDVVNEPVKPNGTFADCIWYRKLGPDYITKAFQYAREADPSAKLFLNDYNQQFGGKKMDLLMKIISDAKKQGATIDGMGFQLHTRLALDVDELSENFRRVANAGLLVHVSELDISVRKNMPKTFILSELLARQQGDKYKEIVKSYLTSVPKKLQWGITTWGVSDETSFFNKGYKNSDHDYPLLFDKNYKAKWAYRGFIEAGLGR